MTELATCPFCNSTDVENMGDYEHDRPLQWHVVCDDCGCRTQFFSNEAEAIAAWNRRATPPAPAWRGIETAPKSTSQAVISNGNIIGHSVKGHYLLGYCPEESVVDPASCISVIWWEPHEKGGVWLAEGALECNPTHWQPLPAAPDGEPK